MQLDPKALHNFVFFTKVVHHGFYKRLYIMVVNLQLNMIMIL